MALRYTQEIQGSLMQIMLQLMEVIENNLIGIYQPGTGIQSYVAGVQV